MTAYLSIVNTAVSPKIHNLLLRNNMISNYFVNSSIVARMEKYKYQLHEKTLEQYRDQIILVSDPVASELATIDCDIFD